MQRFVTNPLWTFILALCLCLGGVAATSGRAYAAKPSAIDTEPLGSGGTGTNYGDPDVPMSPSRKAQMRGGVRSIGGSVRYVGDGSELQGGWMWRLHVVLLSVRGTILHP
jgi:hypothetical protein